MNKKINNYFKNKKIDACIINNTSAFDKVIYDIQLNDITKLNKFNNTMCNELKLLLHKDVEIVNNNKLQIIVHNSIGNTTSNLLKIKIGNTLDNQDIYISLVQEVHLLVAGSTGSGKSVFLNNLINDLINDYNYMLSFYFIDLKKVELARYNALNTCVNFADNIDNALQIFDNVINIMTERYNKYKLYGALNIDEFNNLRPTEKDRYIIVIIDELAELMLQNKKEVQNRLQRILQLGRASGIHVVACTQRPSTDVISGTLKVNFTSRVCFKVQNRHDSVTVLNCKGAEALSGNGDGYLLKNGCTELIRFQALPPTNSGLHNCYKKLDVLDNKKSKINVNKILKYVGIAIICGMVLVIFILKVFVAMLNMMTTIFRIFRR